MKQPPIPNPTNNTSVKTSLNPPKLKRLTSGKFAPGVSGFPGGALADAARARRVLNSRFLAGMTDAYARGGQKAIDKVMQQQPAIFVKMLTLLVPRELEVTHSNAIKQMTDEQIEAAIEHIQAILDKRAAGVIDVTPEPTPVVAEKTQRKRPTNRLMAAADTAQTRHKPKASSD